MEEMQVWKKADHNIICLQTNALRTVGIRNIHKMHILRAGEMTQQLKGFVAFLEDRG